MSTMGKQTCAKGGGAAGRGLPGCWPFPKAHTCEGNRCGVRGPGLLVPLLQTEKRAYAQAHNSRVK